MSGVSTVYVCPRGHISERHGVTAGGEFRCSRGACLAYPVREMRVMSEEAVRTLSEPGPNGLPWEQLARNFVNPVKLQVLHAVRYLESPAGDPGWSPKQLAKLLGLPLPNVSYHVKGLRDAGFIELVGTRPARGAVEHFYRCAA